MCVLENKVNLFINWKKSSFAFLNQFCSVSITLVNITSTWLWFSSAFCAVILALVYISLDIRLIGRLVFVSWLPGHGTRKSLLARRSKNRKIHFRIFQRERTALNMELYIDMQKKKKKNYNFMIYFIELSPEVEI